MKKIKLLLVAIAMMASYSLSAQMAVTTDGSSADGSAMLDIKSTVKGFLPPRMTETQMNDITTPAQWLMVVCTNCDPAGYYYYTGSVWTQIVGNPATGVTAAKPGTMDGYYITDYAFSNTTATFVVSNNGLTPVGPVNFNNAASVGTGTASFSVAAAVAASTNYSAITINSGANQSLIYDVTGKPSAAGTVVIDFSSVGGLTSTATANVISATSVADPGIFAGNYVIGTAFTSSNTVTFTVTNNAAVTVGPYNFTSAASIGAGTATFSIAAGITQSADYSAVSINVGASQDLVYNLTGTPNAAGTYIVDFYRAGVLTASATRNITDSDATFDLPQTEIWASVSSLFVGALTNGHTIDIAYTSGTGTYSAWTSPTYNITDNSGATRTITLSNTEGSFSSSGTITYTINITDGDEADIDVPQQTFGATITMATIDVIVNGNSLGNLLLDATGGYPDSEYGTAGHNYVYKKVDNTTTGETWLNNNLGAIYNDADHANFDMDQQATSIDDANAYGDLYQWGRYSDGHEDRASTTTNTQATTATPNLGNDWDGLFIKESSSPVDWLTPQNNNLWQGELGTNNPCPSGFRLPTRDELDAERISWSSNDYAGAFGSPLKLSVGGYRQNSDGVLNSVGSMGYYWSSTVDGTNAKCITFTHNTAYTVSTFRAEGFTVRCIKD